MGTADLFALPTHDASRRGGIPISSSSSWPATRSAPPPATAAPARADRYFPIVGMIESYCAYGRTLGLQFFVSIDDVEVVNLFGRVDNSDPRLRVSDGTEYDLGASQLIWSMTKIVTAVAVGIAVDRGWIRYSDKVRATLHGCSTTSRAVPRLEEAVDEMDDGAAALLRNDRRLRGFTTTTTRVCVCVCSPSRFDRRTLAPAAASCRDWLPNTFTHTYTHICHSVP